MDITEYLPKQPDSSRGAFRNIALPVLSILETIATSKASKGRYVGTTTTDLMKRLEDQDEYKSEQRAKALDRLLAAQDRQADNKRADEGLALQKETNKRLNLQARAEQDEAERKSHETETAANRKLALSDRLLAAPTTFDQEKGVVTMGTGVRYPKVDKKGEQIWNDGAPAFDYPSLIERALIRKDPDKWVEDKAKDPLADFKAKWDYEIANPKPTTGPNGGDNKPPAGYRWKADGSLEAIPGGPAGGGKPPRDLSPAEMDRLVEKSARFAGVQNLVTRFKPEYSGIGTGSQNAWGKFTGNNAEQVGWWEDYQSLVNQVRNDLFGASLTPGEKSEFEKTIVTHGTNSKIAAANLARQKEILAGAMRRTIATYGAGNVNQEQVKAATAGLDLDIPETIRRAPGANRHSPPQEDPRKALAREALNDPESTPRERAQAQKILDGQ